MREEPCPHTEAMATKVNGWLKEFLILYLYIVLDFFFFFEEAGRTEVLKESVVRLHKNSIIKHTAAYPIHLELSREPFFLNVKDF